MPSTSHPYGVISVRLSPHFGVYLVETNSPADIRFYIASSIGVVSSSLVIPHRLYHIANMTAIATDSSRARRRRNVIIDLLIGLGIPLLAVALCEFSAQTFLSSS